MKRIPADGIRGADAIREAATTELNQVMTLVRAALQARYDAAKKPGESYSWFDIEAMYAERVIVCKDGRYWQFDYSIDAANNVKLAEPKEVIEQFTPVSSSSSVKEAVDQEAVLLEAADPEGKAWEVRIQRAGASRNKWYYPDATLREAAPLLEGVRVLIKGDEEHLAGKGKDVRNLGGWISAPRFVEGRSTDTGEIRATFNVAAGVTALRESMTDAWKRGKRDLVGLSIDAKAKTEPMRGGMRRVNQILSFNSVDLIVEPSAGGALVRLIEAAQEPDPMKEKMLAAIKAKFPNKDVAGMTDDQILEAYSEAIKPEPAPAPAPEQRPAAAGAALTRADLDAFVRITEARASATRKINQTTLPAPSKERLVAHFGGLETFTDADVDAQIKRERDSVVRIAEALGADAGKVKLAVGEIQLEDRSVRMAEMLDAFFDPKHKNHRSVQSIREAYIELTGDRQVTGLLANCNHSRLAESVGMVREAFDSTTLANVLGSSLNRRLVAEYGNITQFDGYLKITGSPVPLSDFRNQERVRFGGFGDLPIVAESGAYLDPDTPTDEKATYRARKRGRTVSITLEMIKNDDVGAVRKIPVRVGRSAKRTLAKFVFDFVLNNGATTYDGVNWFHAGHGNLGAAALDATSLAARRLAMGKQTEKDSGDRLNLHPATILVPLDLEQAAWDLQRRSTNLDKNFVQSLTLDIVPVWYWTDTNDWALFADPNDSQTVELGFLDGQQEPQLFVQDMPNVGSMFSNDEITYKLRHIYGGEVIEHRGADKSVV